MGAGGAVPPGSASLHQPVVASEAVPGLEGDKTSSSERRIGPKSIILRRGPPQTTSGYRDAALGAPQKKTYFHLCCLPAGLATIWGRARR